MGLLHPNMESSFWKGEPGNKGSISLPQTCQKESKTVSIIEIIEFVHTISDHLQNPRVRQLCASSAFEQCDTLLKSIEKTLITSSRYERMPADELLILLNALRSYEEHLAMVHTLPHCVQSLLRCHLTTLLHHQIVNFSEVCLQLQLTSSLSSSGANTTASEVRSKCPETLENVERKVVEILKTMHRDKSDIDAPKVKKAMSACIHVAGCFQPSIKIFQDGLDSFNNGYYNDALIAILQYRSLLKENIIEETTTTADMYGALGISHDRLELFQIAELYFVKEMILRRALVPPLDSSFGQMYNSIGWLFMRQRRYTEALKILKKAMDLNGVDDSRTLELAVTYNNMSAVYSRLGNFDDSIKFAEDSLRIREALGGNHVDVALSYNNIGLTYYYTNQLEESLRMHQKALGIREANLGMNHIDVAISYFNLGNVYSRLGNFIKAVEMHTKALNIKKNKYGECHVEVALSYNYMGIMYGEKCRFSEALEMHSKSLNIRRSLLGEFHIDVATSFNNVGVMYFQEQKYEKAMEMYTEALRIKTSILGKDHSYSFITKCNIEECGDALKRVSKQKFLAS